MVLVGNILTCVDASEWELGRHLPAAIEDLPALQKVYYLSKVALSSIDVLLHASLAIYPLYYVSCFFTKASLLTLYFRLFSPNRKIPSCHLYHRRNYLLASCELRLCNSLPVNSGSRFLGPQPGCQVCEY